MFKKEIRQFIRSMACKVAVVCVILAWLPLVFADKSITDITEVKELLLQSIKIVWD